MSETLTDRERAALTVLRDSACLMHPARIAHLIGDKRPTAGIGYRNTLDALERRGLVRSVYRTFSGAQGRDYAITSAGIEAL